jgi:hypothetical protein
MERLFEAGALDVALMHLQMKKNRPGFAIRVLARPSERELLARVLFAESTTLGVRVAEMERVVLAREERKVATSFGSIRVKIARDASGRGMPSAAREVQGRRGGPAYRCGGRSCCGGDCPGSMSRRRAEAESASPPCETTDALTSQ